MIYDESIFNEKYCLLWSVIIIIIIIIKRNLYREEKGKLMGY
jgi:hypothetical protein